MLQTGRFLNAIIVLVIALSAWGLTLFLFRNWQEMDKKTKILALFWLSTACLWTTVTARSLAAAFDNLPLDMESFKVAQVFVFLSSGLLGRYVFQATFRTRKAIVLTATIFYIIISSFGIFFTYYFGVESVDLDNFFTTEYSPNAYAKYAFLIAVIPIIGMLLFDILGGVKRFIEKKPDVLRETGISLSLLFYLIVGYIDQVGFSGWKILLVRMLFVATFLFSYISLYRTFDTDTMYEEIKI